MEKIWVDDGGFSSTTSILANGGRSASFLFSRKWHSCIAQNEWDKGHDRHAGFRSLTGDSF